MERCIGTCVCFTGNNDWCAWRGALGLVCVLLVILTGVHGEVRWDVCVFTGNNDWCAWRGALGRVCVYW